MGGRCNSRKNVYQSCISPMEHNSDGERVYIGISAGNWKRRCYNHRHSFSSPRLRNQAAQSKYFWHLKDQGLTPQLKWKIIRQSSAVNNFNGRCNLCIDEKISIVNFRNRILLLNERNELVFKCRHEENSYHPDWKPLKHRFLCNCKDNDDGLVWFLCLMAYQPLRVI